MRRSSVIITAIMLIGFGVMFAAAGSALRPLARDADVSRELTRLFEHRGDLVEKTQVRVRRMPAAEERLAEEGLGLVIRIQPAPEVASRKSGLRILALRAAREALGRYPGAPLDWVEVVLDVGEEPAGRLRTLLQGGEGGSLGAPTPALPLRWPPAGS